MRWFIKFADLFPVLFFLLTATIWWLVVFFPFIPFIFFGKKGTYLLRRIYNKLHGEILWTLLPPSLKNEHKYIHKGDKVLDLGAGSGFRGREIAKRFKTKVTLCDVADFNKTDLQLVIYNDKKLPFKSKTFDIVYLAYVLHHTSDIDKLLIEVKRVCKGHVIIYEDNNDNLFSRVFTHIHGVCFNWLNQLSSTYNFLSKCEWEKKFQNFGFEILENKTNWRLDSLTYPVKDCFFVLRV